MHFFPILICAALLLSSCTSGIPEPVSFPYSQQQKMQASHHWQVLALDLADRINNELILTDNIETAVFVNPTCGDESQPCKPNQASSFNKAFRDLLITNLVDYGIPTHKQFKEDAIGIEYKVQIVHHTTHRVRTLQPGLLTAISAAIVVLRDAPAELLILAAGVVADLANTSLTLNGHYEVIITTSIIDNDKYLFRASDIYYINDKDFWQYQDTTEQTKTIELSTRYDKFETPPVPLKEIRIQESAPGNTPVEFNRKTDI